MGSGCSPYYNTHKTSVSNTRMVRYFDEDRFEIFAARDIAAGEEVRREGVRGWGKAVVCGVWVGKAAERTLSVSGLTLPLPSLPPSHHHMYTSLQLLHTYKSLQWRACFKPLADMLGADEEKK